MTRGLIAIICIVALTMPRLAAAADSKFQIEEATIDGIQSAILKGELTSTDVVKRYLARIKAYDGPCVSQPDGILGKARRSSPPARPGRATRCAGCRSTRWTCASPRRSRW